MRSLPIFALIRLALAGDARATFPGGEGRGLRIATPVCGLVRNDMRDSLVPGATGGLPRQCAHWLAMTSQYYKITHKRTKSAPAVGRG